jgi:hypothetical protein
VARKIAHSVPSPSATCGFGTNTVTPPPNSAASTGLNINITSGTPAGSYPITVTGTSGSLTHSSGFTIAVVPAVPNFTISATPSSLSIRRGQSGGIEEVTFRGPSAVAAAACNGGFRNGQLTMDNGRHWEANHAAKKPF